MNAFVGACDKRVLQCTYEPARTASIAHWLALGVNVASKYQRVLDGYIWTDLANTAHAR